MENVNNTRNGFQQTESKKDLAIQKMSENLNK